MDDGLFESMPFDPNAVVASKIEVSGIVQGVGFRPFIYQLALAHGLFGEVSNTATGVVIILEGPPSAIDAFCENLPRKKPPLAHIVEIDRHPHPVNGYTGFSITDSKNAAHRSTLISPDVAVCDDCLKELFDPGNRRYRYPFINCTNCGPRYTIIDDIPYDRPKTVMRNFPLCDKCRTEYEHPDDRRFHAQPNACADCGPRVCLHDARGLPVGGADPIETAADLLKQGRILAVKGLGGFHLAVDAVNDAAVQRLRRRKRREEKPFALMSPDLDIIKTYCRVRPEDEALLTAIQRPIVLLEKRIPSPLSYAVAPRNRYFGVMLPYTPLHHLLMAQGFLALVMTSGNLSEEPISIDNDDAFQRLGAIADYFLIHNRDIYLRSDDSIVRHAAGETRFIRRSRGYVPVPIFMKTRLPSILACGAELKNTICLTKDKFAFLSQHIGDIENPATDDFFRLTVTHLQRILDIEPEVIACDLHPDYMSTRYARERNNIPLIQVQHHHAHIAAGMAEHRLDGPVIGLAFDGTGFGRDGTIWGGEVLLTEYASYRRLAHMDYVPMPGSTAAIKSPWRMALSYLKSAFGDDMWGMDLPLFRQVDEGDARIISEMVVRRLNAPLTSSLGRLFDGVAALVGLRQEVAFEGQAAMELEMSADENPAEPYPFRWEGRRVRRILTQPIIRGIVADLRNGVPVFVISRRFHQTLIALFAALCGVLRDELRLNRVVLSGGVFQNVLLLEGLTTALQKQGFEVFTHRQVPANDGGIALGQAMIAAARIKE